jgi:hypothetical protein
VKLNRSTTLSIAAYAELLFPEDIKGPLTEHKILEEAKLTCNDKRWCGLIHLCAMAHALERPIQSIYPDCNLAIRSMFNNLLLPLPPSLAEGRRGLMILWSRDGDLDKKGWYQPNHFVPILMSKSTSIDWNEDDVPDDVLLEMMQHFPDHKYQANLYDPESEESTNQTNSHNQDSTIMGSHGNEEASQQPKPGSKDSTIMALQGNEDASQQPKPGSQDSTITGSHGNEEARQQPKPGGQD